MDPEDIEQRRFFEYIARRAGTRHWFIRERGGQGHHSATAKPITRKEFERWRADYHRSKEDA